MNQRSIIWHDALGIRIYGQGWPQECKPYHRLPEWAREFVPRRVWSFSQHPAGMYVQFVTNSGSVHVRWKLMIRVRVPHMTASGLSGVDLYSRLPCSKSWRYVNTGFPGKSNETEFPLVDNVEPLEREYILYLPLFTGLRHLYIGLEAGAKLHGPMNGDNYEEPLPICFYGTSLTQGACASRPGLAYPAFVGRLLDCPVLNFGFSGVGKMEIDVAKCLSRLKVASFVVDCTPNMSEEEITARCVPFVRMLSKSNPGVPIVLLECPPHANAWFFHEYQQKYLAKRRALYKAYQALSSDSVGPVHLLPESTLGQAGTEGCLGGHSNDLGLYRFGAALAEALAGVLGCLAPVGNGEAGV